MLLNDSTYNLCLLFWFSPKHSVWNVDELSNQLFTWPICSKLGMDAMFEQPGTKASCFHTHRIICGWVFVIFLLFFIIKKNYSLPPQS
jgi:hypothetical protein